MTAILTGERRLLLKEDYFMDDGTIIPKNSILTKISWGGSNEFGGYWISENKVWNGNYHEFDEESLACFRQEDHLELLIL